MASPDTPAPDLAAPAAGRLAVALWAALLTAVLTVPLLGGGAPGDFLIRNTIRLSLAYWAAAVAVRLSMRPADWAGGPAVALARSLWTLAWLAFLVHLGMAA